jgi:hypothetical protein
MLPHAQVGKPNTDHIVGEGPLLPLPSSPVGPAGGLSQSPFFIASNGHGKAKNAQNGSHGLPHRQRYPPPISLKHQTNCTMVAQATSRLNVIPLTVI